MSFLRIVDRARFDAAKMQKCNLFASERFLLDVYALEAGQEQKPHAHASADKVYVAIEGAVRVRIGAEERALGPGEAAHSAAGIEHALSNPGPARALVLVFMTPPPEGV